MNQSNQLLPIFLAVATIVFLIEAAVGVSTWKSRLSTSPRWRSLQWAVGFY